MKTQLTVSEKIQNQANTLDDKKQHSMKLFMALGGHPEDFAWNGEILEMDNNSKCACGHPIKNGFPLVHKTDGTIVIVGCVCVETAPGMTAELIEQMQGAGKALAAKIAAAKKAEKDMVQDAQIATLDTQRTDLIAAAKALRAAHSMVRVSYGYWQVCAGKYGFKRVACYKSKSACIKSLTADIAFLQSCLAQLADLETAPATKYKFSF